MRNYLIVLLIIATGSMLFAAGWFAFGEDQAYDVVVFGGEPEGVAAAVAAARNGSKTLLVAEEERLGGLMTKGMLNFLDLSMDMDGNPLNTGIFQEWHERVGGQVGFDIEAAETAFHELVEGEENLELIAGAELEGIIKEGSQLVGVKVTDAEGKTVAISAKRFIDSTKDADLAAEAGAPYYIGGEDVGVEDRRMAVTLMIHLKGVDWHGIQLAAKNGVFGGGGVNGNTAWGFGELHFDYTPHFKKETRLRGLNIMRQSDGTIVINALQVFGIDGLDPESRAKAIEIGKEETGYIVEFLRENFPGFENAEVASYPEELYIRETRHVKAEYQLPLSDVWEFKDHWDSIGFGGYPVDEQATSIEDYGAVYSSPVQYAIPFRSLVPLEVDGLLVASKASGYSSLAAGSARVLPAGMTTAQAAGTAAALSIEEETGFREMAADKALIHELQERLKQQGVNLYPFELAYPYQGEWFYPQLKALLNLGLIKGAYENKMPVDETMALKDFTLILNKGASRIAGLAGSDAKPAVQLSEDETELQRDKAAELVLQLTGEELAGTDVWQQAISAGLVDETLQERLQENRPLNGAEAYSLAAAAVEKLKSEQ
ncbi:FAD-dependent oxidoreductase [Planococcus koreensis]|uniref:FAD-dependent oxidoreductase n=1 Tax=Planococcus koreensis TaxID=112331 RepID=UPI0039FBA41B